MKQTGLGAVSVIRERVPHKLPQTVLLLVAYGVVLIAAWWLAR